MPESWVTFQGHSLPKVEDHSQFYYFSQLKDSAEQITDILKVGAKPGHSGSSLEGGIQDHSPYFDVNIDAQFGSDLKFFRATWGKWKKAVNEHLLSSRL